MQQTRLAKINEANNIYAIIIVAAVAITALSRQKQPPNDIVITEAVAQERSVKKGVLRNFAKFTENACVRVSFIIKLQA